MFSIYTPNVLYVYEWYILWTFYTFDGIYIHVYIYYVCTGIISKILFLKYMFYRSKVLAFNTTYHFYIKT